MNNSKEKYTIIVSHFQYLTDNAIWNTIDNIRKSNNLIICHVLTPYYKNNWDYPLSYTTIYEYLNKYINPIAIFSSPQYVNNTYTETNANDVKRAFIAAFADANFETVYLDAINCNSTNVNSDIYNITKDNNTLEYYKGKIAGAFETQKAGYAKTILCTDIAILDGKNENIWLGKRSTENKWRFIGGHVDSGVDLNCEAAAKRELIEEAGSFESTPMQYIWSGLINDPRYLNLRDSIYTIFYKTNVVFGLPKAGSDINEIKMFSMLEFVQNYETLLVPEHVILGEKLLKNLK